MKKILAIALALVTILSLASCAAKETPETPEETTQAAATQLEGDLKSIASKVIENTTTIEMMLMDPDFVDFSDVDVAKYYIGVDPTDKVDSAVFVDPAIGSIPFSMVVMKAKEGADIEALKEEISKGIDLRKWVCVAAEKAVIANCGDTILMVMSTQTIADDVYNAFNIVASGTASAPLVVEGEINEMPPVDGDVAIDEPAAMPGEDEGIILG